MKDQKMREIVIFGTAERANEVYKILLYLPEYKVVAFSDNNPLKWRTQKFGLDVISPNDIKYQYTNSTVIIASSYYFDIGMQLIKNDLLPKGGFLDSVNSVIGMLSDSEKIELKKKIQTPIIYHNLDYREVKFRENDGGTGKYLVICNGGYPKEGNPRCAFAHRRVIKYAENKINIEAFGYIENASFDEYEYQGIQVYEGGMLELQHLLASRTYKKILIHFVGKAVMYCIYKAKKMETQMIVWCHGYEVMPWFRTWFNYTNDEIEQYSEMWNREDGKRKEFLRELFRLTNIHFIFVSSYLKERVKKFVGELPINYSIIHNFIDSEFYAVPDKQPESRQRILSIKSHMTRMYANDLIVKVIFELAKKDFFPRLTFELYGDGILFEENFEELRKRNYSNVHIHKEFLNQEQMRELFGRNGIFLSPTRADSQQVISGEAMSAGMAVITCNVGAINEFMNEECASLFEYENYFMMAEEIEYLYFHPEEYLKKCKNARIRAEKQCGYDNTIQKEIDLILQ